jgi:hypothetical protein
MGGSADIQKLSWFLSLSQNLLQLWMDEAPENCSVLEKLLDGLERRYDFSDCDGSPGGIIDFIEHTISVPRSFLTFLGADDEDFCFGMTLREVVRLILERFLESDDRVASINGFPSMLRFTELSTVARLFYGERRWFPCTSRPKDSSGYYNLLASILPTLSLNSHTETLLFHGTSWHSALKIMRKISIQVPRRGVSDFGLYNFYLTDSFYNACKWSHRNSQAAVIFFVIPNEMLHKWKMIDLSILEEWKNIVYQLRTEPSDEECLGEMDSAGYCDKVEEYGKLLQSLDSYDVVRGRIVKNPSALLAHGVEFISYPWGEVPIQYSFKVKAAETLDNFNAMSLFFPEMNFIE